MLESGFTKEKKRAVSKFWRFEDSWSLAHFWTNLGLKVWLEVRFGAKVDVESHKLRGLSFFLEFRF